MLAYKNFILFSLFVSTLIGLGQFFFPAYVLNFSWLVYLFFVFLTFVTEFLVKRGVQKGDNYDFYNSVMGSFSIRLLLSAIVLFAYYFKIEEDQLQFTITFFVLYFLFTSFEISSLVSILQHNQKSVSQSDEKI